MEHIFSGLTDKMEKRFDKKIEDVLTKNFTFNEFLHDRQDFIENLTKLQDVIEKCFNKNELVNEQLSNFKVDIDNKFKEMEDFFTNNLKHNDFVQLMDSKFNELNDRFEKFFTKPKNFTEHFDISDNLQNDTETSFLTFTTMTTSTSATI
jgi:hypothetical protein